MKQTCKKLAKICIFVCMLLALTKISLIAESSPADAAAIKKEASAKIETVNLSSTKFTYNGEVRKPTVTVKDSAGNKVSSSYYSVTYAKGRKNVE